MKDSSFGLAQRATLTLSLSAALSAARAGLMSQGQLDACANDLAALSDQLDREAVADGKPKPVLFRTAEEEFRQTTARPPA